MKTAVVRPPLLPFNLPAQRDFSGNHASVSLSIGGPLGSGDRCAGGRVIMSPDTPRHRTDLQAAHRI